jgi:crossover junction endodeoxyribonuclease RuvC
MPDPKSILAIDPGTRVMGIAFLEKGKLIYYGVKTIKDGTRLPHERLREARKAVLRLIQDFHPEVLAIEKTFFSNNRNIALLNVLAEEIKAIARRKGLKVFSLAPSTVKKHICGNGRAKKREVAEMVIARYPELKVLISQDRKWKEAYWQNVFDALALGMAVSKTVGKP